MNWVEYVKEHAHVIIKKSLLGNTLDKSRRPQFVTFHNNRVCDELSSE